MPNDQNRVALLLLPGLHGTAGLFRDFVAQAPPTVRPVLISYPVSEPKTYSELADWLCRIAQDIPEPLVLLGESFSGPLSLMVATRLPQRVLAVVLVATFVQPPRSPLLRFLPWSLGFRCARPLYWLRAILARQVQTAGVIAAISQELQQVRSTVLAHRVRETLTVDARPVLQTCAAPLLYLQAQFDLIVPSSALKKILAANGKVAVRTFPTQHFLLQASPTAAWQAIEAFLDDLRSGH